MALHERFVGHAPRGGKPREHGPLMARRETRGAVPAQHARHEETAAEADVQSREERRELALAVPRVRIPDRRRRAGVQIVHAVCVGDEPLRSGRELLVVVLRVLLPPPELEFVLAEILRAREEPLDVRLLPPPLCPPSLPPAPP